MENSSKKKILIMDDDVNVRTCVISILIDEGYECQEAEDGKTGVALALTFLPDVIVCDVQMPQMDGHEVFQQLSQNPQTARIPFIFVTGLATREDIRKGMASGADDYLTKPFSTAELLNSIRARLKKKETQDLHSHREIQQIKENFTQQISYDSLTGLPNRSMQLKQFEAMAQSNPPALCVAALSIAIDNLGLIIEAFGPSCGDLVLQKTAEQLKRHLNSDAFLFRGAQDAFNILIRNAKDEKKLSALMSGIIQTLSESFSFEAHVFRRKVSIGCTLHSFERPDQAENILNHAETARHYARKEGEKEYQFYHPEMQKSVVNRLTLENHLYKALEHHELSLVYQPQLDIKTQKIKAVEALVRWNSAALGSISPVQFIPVAEETGLILPIGKWVLEESCRQLKKWRAAGLDLRMAVNISGRQLESGDLVTQVEEALTQHEIPPAFLEIEITEGLLIKNSESTISQMKALKNKGVMIAIDDFGTGYSSLGSLKKFPFDTLKIDRSFIRDIETHASNTEIVSAIIKMAQTLKLKTIAEGVETRGQLDCLKTLHCDEFQGFFFSRPVPAVELPALLKRQV